MSLATLLPTNVVISTYSQGAADSHGVPVPTWTDQTAVKGRLQQIGGTEVTDGIQEAVSDWTLSLMPNVAINPQDRVKANGITFEVVGPPWQVPGRAGATHHVEARLRAVK